MLKTIRPQQIVMAISALAFAIAVTYQGCSQKKFIVDLTSNDSIETEVQILDTLDGSFRPLFSSRKNQQVDLSTDVTYKLMVLPPNENEFPKEVVLDWQMSGAQSQDACQITKNNSAIKTEAMLICRQAGLFKVKLVMKAGVENTSLVLNEVEFSVHLLALENLKARGEQIYQNYCQMCHNESGSGRKINKSADQIARAISDNNNPSMSRAPLLSALTATELRALSAAMTSVATVDQIPPQIEILQPIPDSVLYGLQQVMVQAQDDSGIASVQMNIDTQTDGPQLIIEPYNFNLDTLNLMNGEHTLKIIATDTVGNSRSEIIVFEVNNANPPTDTIPPSITFTNLENGFVVNDPFLAQARATDLGGIAGVQFQVDQQNMGSMDTTPPFEIVMSAGTFTHGTSHELKAIARDNAGLTQSATLQFVVDKEGPQIEIEQPLSGGTLTGIFSVNLTAEDDNAVASTSLKIDGSSVGESDSTSPYAIILNSHGITNGTHLLTAVAVDRAGNQSTHSISVRVNNVSQETLTEAQLAALYPANSTHILLGQNLWNTHCQSCHQNAEKRDKTYSYLRQMIGINSSQAVMRALNLTDPDVYKLYLYLNNELDTAPPSINITSATANQVLSGSTVVRATITDAHALRGAHLRVDNVVTGATLSSQTNNLYIFNLNTTTLTNGTHVLKVVAQDIYDNEAMRTVQVRVNNVVVPVDTTPPQVAFDSPDANQIVSTNPMARVSAIDNVGVTGVKIFLNDALLGAELTAPPFERSIDIGPLTEGTHVLKTQARDRAQNQSTFATLRFIVDKTAPTVAFQGLTSNQTVSGGSLMIRAQVTDAFGVKSSWLQIDGVTQGTALLGGNFQKLINTLNITNGTHVFKMIGEDKSGRSAFALLNLVVHNQSVYNTPESELAANFPLNRSNLLAGQTLWNTNCASCHNPQTGGEKRNRTYTDIRSVVSHDSRIVAMRGLNLPSPDVYKIYLYLNNILDVSPPTINITSATANQVLSGSTVVRATITDAHALRGAHLRVDNVVTGATLSGQTNNNYVFNLNTTNLTNGTHTLKVVAQDIYENEAMRTVQVRVNNVVVPVDTTPPQVAFDSPEANQILSTNPVARVSAMDNVGVTGVKIFLNNTLVGTELTSAPYERSIDIGPLTEGTHVLKTQARDRAQNQSTFATLRFIVDKTAPTVAFQGLTSNQTVSGGSLMIRAQVTDAFGVKSSWLQIDGVTQGTALLTGNFQKQINTLNITNGTHLFKVMGEDKSGLSAFASMRLVVFNQTLYNTPLSQLQNSIPTNRANILAGKTLWDANCAGCHNSQTGGEKRGRAYDHLRSKVGTGSSISGMNNLMVTSADLYKIYLYLNNTLPNTTSSYASQTQVVVGTRTYLASYFKNIFVSDEIISNGTLSAGDNNLVNRINANLYSQVGALGGICKRNDGIDNYSQATCLSNWRVASEAEMLPQNSALRRGYITKTCEEVLSINLAVQNALDKVSLTSTDSLTSANITKIYDLFSPGKPIGVSVLNNLVVLSQQNSLDTNLDKWRMVMYAICRSAGNDLL